MEKKTTNNDKKQKKGKLITLLLCALLILLIAAVGVTCWAIFFRETEKPALIPDYAPRETESYAEPINAADEEKLPQEEGGGAVNINYFTEVEADLLENTLGLYFANPARSNQDMVLQIVVQGTVLAQSGRICPGSMVKKLDILSEVALSPGVYDAKMVVLFYQPDTGEKAMLNTEIPITLTVPEV